MLQDIYRTLHCSECSCTLELVLVHLSLDMCLLIGRCYESSHFSHVIGHESSVLFIWILRICICLYLFSKFVRYLFLVPCPHLDHKVVEAPPEVHGLGHRGGDRGVQVRHGQERRGA